VFTRFTGPRRAVENTVRVAPSADWSCAMPEPLSPPVAVHRPAPALAPVPHEDAPVIDRVRNEYLEMPGLSVTLPQAERLWQIDAQTCQQVLGRLVEIGFLVQSARGRYVRRLAMQ
jgi:hypothetical protein